MSVHGCPALSVSPASTHSVRVVRKLLANGEQEQSGSRAWLTAVGRRVQETPRASRLLPKGRRVFPSVLWTM